MRSRQKRTDGCSERVRFAGSQFGRTDGQTVSSAEARHPRPPPPGVTEGHGSIIFKYPICPSPRDPSLFSVVYSIQVPPIQSDTSREMELLLLLPRILDPVVLPEGLTSKMLTSVPGPKQLGSARGLLLAPLLDSVDKRKYFYSSTRREGEFFSLGLYWSATCLRVLFVFIGSNLSRARQDVKRKCETRANFSSLSE